MGGAVPERIRAAVAALDVRPDDRLLEIGCGPGAAVELVAERLDGGTIVAIDRSPVAVERARWRNEAHVASGRAIVRHVALEELEPAGETYDKVFAININLFWTRDAGHELELVRRLLAPGGALHLFYDGAAADAKPEAIAGTIVAALEAHGYRAERLAPPLLGIVARP